MSAPGAAKHIVRIEGWKTVRFIPIHQMILSASLILTGATLVICLRNF